MVVPPVMMLPSGQFILGRLKSPSRRISGQGVESHIMVFDNTDRACLKDSLGQSGGLYSIAMMMHCFSSFIIHRLQCLSVYSASALNGWLLSI